MTALKLENDYEIFLGNLLNRGKGRVKRTSMWLNFNSFTWNFKIHSIEDHHNNNLNFFY